MMVHERITTFLQPIYDVHANQTFGFEALNPPGDFTYFQNTDDFYKFVGQTKIVFLFERFSRNLSSRCYQMIDAKIAKVLHNEPFTLISIDIDRFKMFNDLYGFNRGDKVLLYLTNILKACVHQADAFLGHLGGDHFVVILPHYDAVSLCKYIISRFDE